MLQLRCIRRDDPRLTYLRDERRILVFELHAGYLFEPIDLGEQDAGIAAYLIKVIANHTLRGSGDRQIKARRYVLFIASKRARRRWRLRAKSSRLPMQGGLMAKDPTAQSQKIISAGRDSLLVLITEDEALIKINLEEVVTEAGFENLGFSNADEAIRALEKDSARFCAVITDIRMPGKTDGWDLARRARELQPHMPVIYITGDSAKDWAAQGVPNSVLLQKPFVHAQLITALTTLLNEAGTTRIDP